MFNVFCFKMIVVVAPYEQVGNGLLTFLKDAQHLAGLCFIVICLNNSHAQ